MRSIMMKVNYDPKYMFPNSSPAKSSDRTLNDRLGVMKGIYRNPERNTRGRLYEVSPKRVVQVCQNVPKPKQVGRPTWKIRMVNNFQVQYTDRGLIRTLFIYKPYFEINTFLYF